ncbi:MAG: hypothetical protein ACI85K_002839 [Hyphomicrobiaceae bacterium]|jgi:hypothetical protein
MSEDSERYARIHEILSSTEALTGSDLDAHLAEQCGDDHVLRSQVEELLTAGADEEASDAFSEASMARSRQALDRAVDGEAASWLPAWCPETRPSRFGIELVTQDSSTTK